MLSWGYSAYDIGEKLNVSFRTVEKDIQLMKEHYKAKNQTHLACIGLRREIIK
jgi:DNA-binding NarL/FixJ family response regulator